MIACAYGNSRCINASLGTPRIERASGVRCLDSTHRFGGGGEVTRSCICTMSLTHARTHAHSIPCHVGTVHCPTQPTERHHHSNGRGAPALAREGLQRVLETHAPDQMRGGRADLRAPSSQASACFLCCRDEERSIGNLSRERYALNRGRIRSGICKLTFFFYSFFTANAVQSILPPNCFEIAAR